MCCAVLSGLHKQPLFLDIEQEDHALAGFGGGHSVEAVAVALVLAPP